VAYLVGLLVVGEPFNFSRLVHAPGLMPSEGAPLSEEPPDSAVAVARASVQGRLARRIAAPHGCTIRERREVGSLFLSDRGLVLGQPRLSCGLSIPIRC
jgi:hypothetical protein